MSIAEFFTRFEHYIYVFGISMLPIIELKGAMPVGLALGLGTWNTFFTALIGSCLPIPFLILLIKRILKWLTECNIKLFNRIATFLTKKIEKGQNSKAFRTSAILGLFLFVAIPLPTTGVWTGSMIAGVLNMPLKIALPIIVFGNTVAGLIVLFASHLIIV